VILASCFLIYYLYENIRKCQCLCHSGKKYKKCCQLFQKGANPSNAMLLMRSRYSAFALKLADYIMATTYPENLDYTNDILEWENSILSFSNSASFIGLE